MRGPKPYKLIGFGDNHGPKPYALIGFGDIHGPKPYKLIGFGDSYGPKPYELIGERGPPARPCQFRVPYSGDPGGVGYPEPGYPQDPDILSGP